MKLPLLLAAAASLAAGQICAPEPKMARTLADARYLPEEQRLAAARILLRQNPSDFWARSFYFESVFDPQARIRETQLELRQHPDDAYAIYYAGSALIGVRTVEAIQYLERAQTIAPQLGPTHVRLAFVYSSPNFGDPGKLRREVEDYLHLCPNGDIGMYSYLKQIDDPELLRDQTPKLREALASRTEAADLNWYWLLWRLETKSAPSEPQPDRTSRIRGDIQRLAAATGSDHRLLYTLRTGYEMIQDDDAGRSIDEQDFTLAERRWNLEHPNPLRHGEHDQKVLQDYFLERLRATSEWVRRWPDNLSAWQFHTDALSATHAAPGKIQAALDTRLRLATNSFDPPSDRISIARRFLDRNLRVGELENIVKDALADLDRRRIDPPSDLDPEAWSQNYERVIIETKIRGLDVLSAVYEAISRPADMEVALDRLRQTLDARRELGMTAAQRSSWKRSYGDYWLKMGRCAEMQTRVREAMVFYLRASDLNWYDSGVRTPQPNDARVKAHQLWASLGGSDEGWIEYTRHSGQAPDPESLKVALGGEAGEVGKKLPDFAAPDLTGRNWTLADLKGKATLINVWATWCGVCLVELPQVQKVYDALKSHPGIRVITLNVDADPDVVTTFMEHTSYTFPVICGESLYRKVAGEGGIPRTWLIDNAGVIRSASFGLLEGYAAEWQQHIITSLEKMAAEPNSR
jgi:thiol-disulfide isomerase/thioredoxin